MDPERGDKRGWSSFWTQRAHVAHLAPPWLSHRKNSRVANARHSVDDTRFAPSVGSAHRDHRYWMGSVLYGLGRYDGARPYVESLAREFPAQLRLKGLAALVAARRHDFVAAERWLEPAAPINLAEHMVRCARIVVIQGKREAAITAFTSAADHGITNHPWLMALAYRDLSGPLQHPRGVALLSGR